MTETMLFAFPFLSALVFGYGNPSQCTNPSLTWTIYQSYADPMTKVGYTSAIHGDSSSTSVYVDGTPGAIATLFLCDTQTLDATLTVGNPRTVSVSFSRILEAPSGIPSWASSGSEVTGTTAIDVRAMGYVPAGYMRSQEFAFTTRFNMSIPENGNWGLHFLNPNPSAPSTDPYGPASNPPNATYYDSLVNVQHCPAMDAAPVSPLCSSGAPETWIVWPDSTTTPAQVATLLNQKKTPGVNAGQFSMPFYFVIMLN